MVELNEITLPINQLGQTWDCANTINSTGKEPRYILLTESQMPATTSEYGEQNVTTQEYCI
jgi:hypothetical protein